MISVKESRYESESLIQTPLHEIQSALGIAMKSQHKEQIEQECLRLFQTIRQMADGNRNQAVSTVYNTFLQLEQELIQFGVEAEPHFRIQIRFLNDWLIILPFKRWRKISVCF